MKPRNSLKKAQMMHVVLSTFSMGPLFAYRISPHSLRATTELWNSYTHVSK